MDIRIIDDASTKRIALIYQALPPPVIGGLRKDPKPGGYSDSGADIAYSLRMGGFDVVTPSLHPDPSNVFDWVFPDAAEGLRDAEKMGATVIWANTVLFSGHPVEACMDRLWIVGQVPERQQRVDDKHATNTMLRTHGLPVPVSVLVGRKNHDGIFCFGELTSDRLAACGLRFPLVVKPVRGRGSQGVSRVNDCDALLHEVGELLDSGAFGDLVIVEQYLPGEELTLTVMAQPRIASDDDPVTGPLVLPPVRRFNHADGIAPYNGVVAVTANSVALTEDEASIPALAAIMQACAATFVQVGACAPIRIDCRADEDGIYRIFDVNMKPNMTGAGRPGRDDQDSLSAIAARAIGWKYVDLLAAVLKNAWKIEHR